MPSTQERLGTLQLDHLEGCPEERTETYQWEGATISRCIDCGAHSVKKET